MMAAAVNALVMLPIEANVFALKGIFCSRSAHPYPLQKIFFPFCIIKSPPEKFFSELNFVRYWSITLHVSLSATLSFGFRLFEQFVIRKNTVLVSRIIFFIVMDLALVKVFALLAKKC